MNHSDKGHAGELIGEAWLIKQGYWVFPNVAPHGVIDCVAIHKVTHKTLFVDFKVVSRTKKGWERSRITNELGKQLGVRILYVDLETHECRIKDTWEDYLRKKRKIKMEK